MEILILQILIFLVKYNSSGNKIWSKQVGTNVRDVGEDIAIDSSDNIYIVGYSEGNLNGQVNAGIDGITKYNSSGILQWTKLIGTSDQNDYGYALNINKENIYLAGATFGNLDGNINKGSLDAFD